MTPPNTPTPQLERERDDARAEVERLRETLNESETEANTLAHKLAEAREDNVRIIVERERWRMRAEEKWALRKELEELLGVADAPASDEQFKRGVQRLKDVIRERDQWRECATKTTKPKEETK